MEHVDLTPEQISSLGDPAEATSTLDELRELARGIHPAILVEGGLPPALKTRPPLHQ